MLTPFDGDGSLLLENLFEAVNHSTETDKLMEMKFCSMNNLK